MLSKLSLTYRGQTFESTADGPGGGTEVNDNIHISSASILSALHQLLFIQILIPLHYIDPEAQEIGITI